MEIVTHLLLGVRPKIESIDEVSSLIERLNQQLVLRFWKVGGVDVSEGLRVAAFLYESKESLDLVHEATDGHSFDQSTSYETSRTECVAEAMIDDGAQRPYVQSYVTIIIFGSVWDLVTVDC